jgi:hypothetical protein
LLVCFFPTQKNKITKKKKKKGKETAILTTKLAGDVSVRVQDLKDGNEVEDEDDLLVVENACDVVSNAQWAKFTRLSCG